MVENYSISHFFKIFEFLKNNPSFDFYFTENNERKIINNESILKKLLKHSSSIRVLEERGDILGIILLWKSIGTVSRFYIKLNASNEDVANKLLTVTLWNTKNDLFIKIRKDSKFLSVFKNKGFNFIGDRGREILLMKKFITSVQKEPEHGIDHSKKQD